MIPMWGSPPVLGGLGALGGNGSCYIKLGPCGNNSAFVKLGGRKVSQAEQHVLLPSTRVQRALDPSLTLGGGGGRGGGWAWTQHSFRPGLQSGSSVYQTQ